MPDRSRCELSDYEDGALSCCGHHGGDSSLLLSPGVGPAMVLRQGKLPSGGVGCISARFGGGGGVEPEMPTGRKKVADGPANGGLPLSVTHAIKPTPRCFAKCSSRMVVSSKARTGTTWRAWIEGSEGQNLSPKNALHFRMASWLPGRVTGFCPAITAIGLGAQPTQRTVQFVHGVPTPSP